MYYVWELLNHITNLLVPITDNPRFEAELLLAHSLKVSRSHLLANIREKIEPPEILNELISERLKHKPIAYILGYTEFYSLKIFTQPPVFIPRPETELLVDKAINLIKHSDKNFFRLLELCTGTGCISIAIFKNVTKPISIYATDISKEAIHLAVQNATYHNVNIGFLLADLFSPFASRSFFDIIVCNPPYVSLEEWQSLSTAIKEYEDKNALLSGDNGLQIIRDIVNQSKQYLVNGGYLLFEIGENQREDVLMLLSSAGYTNIEIFCDLQNLPRVAMCKWVAN